MNSANLKILNTLHTKDVVTAQNLALEILNTIKFKNQQAAFRLKTDILKAYSAKEVSRIMWNTQLASDGLRTSDSKWLKSA